MKRMQCSRRGLATCGAALAGFLLAAAPTLAQDKPNIVIIMGDDIGMWTSVPITAA